MNARPDPCRAADALPSGLGPLEVARVPLRPDIRLWLLAPEVDLERACRELADVAAPPFWAFCWGAGQALARYLDAQPEAVRGRDVVDLGAGSGVVAIAAAKAGAARVTAVDLDPAARRAVQANAALNGVAVRVQAELPDAWQVLLAADVLYEPALRDLLEALAEPGRRVLVADPHRQHPHRPPGTPIAEMEASTYPDVDPPVRRITISEL